jgi:replicative DNA helicase
MNDPKPRDRRPRKGGAGLPESLRSLPQSLDAEKGLLGSILLSPERVLDECLTQRVSERYFHAPAHARIFAALVEMQQRKSPVDLITLTQYLADRGALDEVGGPAALTDLFTFVPTAANAAYYLDLMKEKFLLRRIITVCTEFAGRAYDEYGDVAEFLNDVEREVLTIGQDRYGRVRKSIRELSLAALETVDALYQRRGELTGLPTGFPELDRMTNGLQGSEMIVIAARPSMGKTALAMNIVEHVALEAAKSVAVYSLEMSAEQLVLRLLCALARVDLQKIRQGFLNKNEVSAMLAATNRIAESKLFIDDTPSLSVLEFQANARRLKAQEGLDLIVIDYLQLMRSPSRRGQENRQVEVAEISAGIKALAKELKVPVIVLAQLNRNPDTRAGDGKGQPKLSDLRESGSIEQDADIVALLWREAYYATDADKKKAADGRAELTIAKNRNGPVGRVPLTFLKHLTRFESRAEEE